MILFYKLLLLHCMLHMVHAVKIGISRPTEITTTTPATTTIATQIGNTTTTTELTEDLTETSILLNTTQTMQSTTTPAPSNTTIRYFQVPTLPPKTAKPKVVKIRPKTTTTTTTTTTVTPAEYDADDDVDDDEDDNAEDNAKKLKTATKGFTAESNIYCNCNFLTNACDINCCCDTDCSAEALRVFDCHAAPKHPEFNTRLEDFQYQHGLPSCSVNKGWLCVFRTNIKVEQQKAFDIHLDTSKLYKWPSLMLDTVQPSTIVNSLQYYRFGEPLQLINVETLEVKHFELPYYFINSRCQIKEPIKHLKSMNWQCQVNNLEELQQTKRTMFELISESKLLQKPLEQTLNAAESAVGVALDMKLKRCITTTSNDAIADATTCKVANSTELEVENYYPLDIELIFKHNFTHINECVVSLKEQEVKLENQTAEHWQTFNVHFQLHNATNNEYYSVDKKPAISGTLGYLQGEPIIMAKFIAYNESLEMHESNLVLDYFHPNATRWRKQHTLQLPFKQQQECSKNYEKENLINYGVSAHKQCTVRLSANSSYLKPQPGERNFTGICIELQQQAQAQLVMANLTQDIWISQLGKPKNNTQNKWTKLLIKEFDYPPTIGTYNAIAHTFTCQNMLLDVAYEFQIGGNFIEQSVPHQQLVKQATLTFGRRHDVEFSLTESIELPLTVSVMFYNFETSVGMSQNNANSKLLTTGVSITNVLILSLVYKHLA